MSDLEVVADDVATEPSAVGRVAAVVFNPIKVDLEAIKAAVKIEEAAAGWGRTLWFETSEEDPGQGPAAQALAAGVSMIVVAGGDGTVRAVAEAVRGHDVVLALLPSGTGNLLARNLDLTLDDLKGSIHSAFTGEDRKIDLAMVDVRRADSRTDTHAYLVMAGFGLDAKMLANTDDELKAKIGWLAYVKAIGLALRDKNQLHLRCTLDDGPARSLRAHTVIVGNCGSLQGNVQLFPDAVVDDGLLDIVLLRPETLFSWFQIVGKIMWENGVLSRTRAGRSVRTKDVRALTYLTGRRFVLTLKGPEKLEIDGDEFGEAIAIRTWVEPGALTVRVPLESAE
ncbi:diacylglycerol/lipid kinase family protein [Microbacterium deminutum]|uniref:Diacylglycerol kinase family protein n=1 Tax=Microbacterium deminutum TaxID=344164 RepID=A0ABP5BTM2_9MICO